MQTPVLMPPKLFSTRQRQRASAHRSSSRSTPDAITSHLSPRRSPQRSSANADVGGLKPSPAGRLRRARQPPSLRIAPQPTRRPLTGRPAFRVHVHNTTTVFSQRSMRRLEASLRRATSKGHETFTSRTAPHQGTRSYMQALLTFRTHSSAHRVRRSMATSCRSTSSSASLDAADRPSRTSQPQSRTKMRYSRRRDTADHDFLRLTPGASLQLTGNADSWYPTGAGRARRGAPAGPGPLAGCRVAVPGHLATLDAPRLANHPSALLHAQRAFAPVS